MARVVFSEAIAESVMAEAAKLGDNQDAYYLDCTVDESWSKEALVAFARITMKELAELRGLLRYS